MTHSAHIDRFVLERVPPAELRALRLYLGPEFQFGEQANLVARLLDDAVMHKAWGDRPLLRSPHISFSYAQTQARVNRIAQFLTEDMGLMPGNRVLLRGPNTIGLALSWLAVVKAGLIAVGTMPLLRAKELGEIIEKSQPTLALCDARFLEELQTAQAASNILKTIVHYAAAKDPQDLGARCAAKSGLFKACATAADDPAMLAFTSGTTGKPKAVVHTHRDILSACETWPRHVLRARPDDVVLGSPPLAFTFGLGGLLIFPMWAGASVYFHDAPYTPESMVDAINAQGASICYTAPTFYRQMATFAKAKGVRSLRICVSAGEALPDATRRLWKDASGIEMMDGIGATEMFHIFISSPSDELRRSLYGTAIGKVVPGYIAHVVDERGHELPRGEVGRLTVKGPTGCTYLDDVRQANYVKDGWNYPGDSFVQDAEGYYYFQARADDMIISAGYNIGGPEVEDCLLTHPAVAECAVIGKSDTERGMIVKAFCVLKADYVGDASMAHALQEHVKANLAPYKYPREIEFMNALPRTETGKLQRFKLRQSS